LFYHFPQTRCSKEKKGENLRRNTSALSINSIVQIMKEKWEIHSPGSTSPNPSVPLPGLS
jgi:hypothetical protein